MTSREIAAQLIVICKSGFRNEFHHARWLTKHQPEIDRLPQQLRKQVLLAHDQATVPEFSERRTK